MNSTTNTARIMAAFLSDNGAVMRSTQCYGQTRRFLVVRVTPKTVRVREIHRYRSLQTGRHEPWLTTHGDLMTKRVREDGTFTLGRWQIAYLENPEYAAGTSQWPAAPSDYHW